MFYVYIYIRICISYTYQWWGSQMVPCGRTYFDSDTSLVIMFGKIWEVFTRYPIAKTTHINYKFLGCLWNPLHSLCFSVCLPCLFSTQSWSQTAMDPLEKGLGEEILQKSSGWNSRCCTHTHIMVVLKQIQIRFGSNFLPRLTLGHGSRMLYTICFILNVQACASYITIFCAQKPTINHCGTIRKAMPRRHSKQHKHQGNTD